MSKFLRGFASVLAVLVFAGIAQAGIVRGTVNNATTGKPGAGVEVVLIQLQRGMTPVANTKTDASRSIQLRQPGYQRSADAGARHLQRREFSSAAAPWKKLGERRCI